MKDSRLQQINKIIESKNYLQNKDIILGFLKHSEIKYYFLNKLPKRFNNLREIEFLLEELVKDEHPFGLFKILEESISKKNNPFIIIFLQKHYKQLGKKVREGIFQEKSLIIVQKILDQHPNNVNEIFNLIKEILTLRGGKYKKFETTRDYRREKELISELLGKIFSIYQEQKEHKRIKEIITLIDKHFNLVEDDEHFVMYTPNKIFQIIRDFIEIDFEKNFKKIVKLLINQYDQIYKKYGGKVIYKGWELMGSGISQSGDQFSIGDRHFVSYGLQPALENYYEKNKEKAWKFIIDSCINKTEEVDENRPDFLNRTAIPIILDRYKSENKKTSKEVFKILKEFILSPKGIPHKSDLIYQDIRTNFPEDKKWQLVKISIDEYKLPVNPFVEQITLELAEKGNKEAKEVIKGWIKNPDYYKKGRPFEGNIAGIISNFLDFSFDEGVQMFKDFIAQEDFITKFDTFEVFNLARVLNKILYKDFDSGLEILNNLARKPKLGENEQIILCNSLTRKGDSTQENEEILIKIYKEFLDPFLKSFDNDINKIEAKISRSQSREAIVEFAESLAKRKKIPETIRIVKVFINDSDPCTPARVNPADSESKYDEHKRIEQGKDTHAITTVRGWCAWVLMECAILEGRNYIEEIINLTEKLTKDRNYYVQLMSCYPLYQLARNRLAVMPDNKEELFFNKDKEKALKMAKRVEKIAFELLDRFLNLDAKSRDVLMESLLKVFDPIRGLNQKDARLLLKKISECGEKVISEAAPLFIYFAEFRQKDFKDWKLKLPGLYDDLEDFDNKEFQELLKSILNRRNFEINSQFAWHFRKLTEEAAPDKANIKNTVKYSSAFKISYKYLNLLANSYDHQTFTHIYDFIKDNINQCFGNCYKLWRKCLKKEGEALEKLTKEEKAHEIYWWPFHDNGEILMVVKEKGGVKEFLDSFEFLVSYPKEVNIGDINKAVKILQNLPSEYNQRVEEIFNRLIERDPSFYDVKETWRKTKRSE